MEHKDDILIDRFLRGELTEKELISFNQMIEKDEDFRLRVKEMEEIGAGVRESVLKEKRELLEEMESEIMSGDQHSKEANKSIEREVGSGGGWKIRRLWWLAAAVAVLIGVIVVWPEEVKGPSEEYAYLFEEEFETLIKHETMRSSDWDDPYTPEQRKAYNLFAAKEFKKAIPLLEFLWVNNNDILSLRYLSYSYLGIGNLNQGEFYLNLYKTKINDIKSN